MPSPRSILWLKEGQRRPIRHWCTSVCDGTLLGMSDGAIWFHPYNRLPPQREPGDAREISVKPNEVTRAASLERL